MHETPSRRSLRKLTRALGRLDEALAEPEDNPLVIDGTIQRFEFVFELFWKTLRRFLAEEGVTATTPREALQAAFAAGWIADEAAWLAMLEARNETSHTYDEARARDVYTSIRQHFPELAHAHRFLVDRVGAG